MLLAAASKKALLAAGAIALGPAVFAWAQGEGAVTDNPDLLRGSYAPFCEPAMLCHYGSMGAGTIVPDEAAPPAVAAPAAAPQAVAAPVPEAIVVTAARPEPVVVPLHDPAPADAIAAPPWTQETSLGLRGSYVSTQGEGRFELLAVPQLEAAFRGGRTEADAAVAAEIVAPQDADARVGSARVSAAVRHRLDSWTRLAADTALTLSQDDPRDLSELPSGAMTAPLEFTGTAGMSLARDFGRASATVSASLTRRSVGESILADGTVADNAHRNVTEVSGSLRLGHRLTPVLGVFAEAEAGRDRFDAPEPETGASRDGWNQSLRAGVSGSWNEVLLMEASVGRGWRAFEDPGLAPVESWLYGASLAFRPNATTQLRAGFDTAIIPLAGRAAPASIDHTLTLEAGYQANPWLGLRASGAITWRDVVGEEAERRYALGVGADLAVGPHTAVSADYGFALREEGGATPQSREEHRVTLGVTLRR